MHGAAHGPRPELPELWHNSHQSSGRAERWHDCSLAALAKDSSIARVFYGSYKCSNENKPCACAEHKVINAETSWMKSQAAVSSDKIVFRALASAWDARGSVAFLSHYLIAAI